MVFILVSHQDVPLTRCLVMRYILVWPQNKGHAKSLSCKIKATLSNFFLSFCILIVFLARAVYTVGADLKRAHYSGRLFTWSMRSLTSDENPKASRMTYSTAYRMSKVS